MPRVVSHNAFFGPGVFVPVSEENESWTSVNDFRKFNVDKVKHVLFKLKVIYGFYSIDTERDLSFTAFATTNMALTDGDNLVDN